MFGLNLLVRNPSDEFVKEVRKQHYYARLSRSGVLVMSLSGDRELSARINPQQWSLCDGKDGSFYLGYAPNYEANGGVVYVAHTVPEVFADASYELRFDEAEVNSSGYYCQIVTAYNGERPGLPYRREGRGRLDSEKDHATSSVFSLREAGRVRLDFRPGRLEVARASTEVIDGVLMVRMEQLAFVQPPELSWELVQNGFADESLATWNDALKALHERVRCQDSYCEGHYHG